MELLMPLILRVDVDKPYGRSNIKEKILSKVREVFWFPSVFCLGYLSHLKKLLVFLSEENIKAHVYFRKCTLPPKIWFDDSLLDGHMIGHHAENTRNFETFKKEFEEIQVHFHPKKISSFTKHGSGEWKSGRNHYPSYEPDKYLDWAEVLGIPFLFGNGEISKLSKFPRQNQFYPNMFWVDRFHSNREQFTLQWIINVARDKNVIVIIHPANFVANKWVEDNMKKLVCLASTNNVIWKTI